MSNANKPIERSYETFYLLAIGMFALSVTIFEIFIYNYRLRDDEFDLEL